MASTVAKVTKALALNLIKNSLHVQSQDMPATSPLYAQYGHLILQTRLEDGAFRDLPRADQTRTDIEQGLANISERDANRKLFTDKLMALDAATAKEGTLEKSKQLETAFKQIAGDVPKLFEEIAKKAPTKNVSTLLSELQADIKKRFEETRLQLKNIQRDRAPLESQLARVKQEYESLNTLVNPKKLHEHEKGQAERKISQPPQLS